MFKKGFSTILIVVIVLVVIAGGILVWQFWPESAEQGLTTEDKTSNRKIYKDIESNFELSYPQDWILWDLVAPSEVRFYDPRYVEAKGDIEAMMDLPVVYLFVRMNRGGTMYKDMNGDEIVIDMLNRPTKTSSYEEITLQGRKAYKLVEESF